MSDLSTYPKWPGIVAIVAVSLAGAVVVFLAGFAAGRCGARPHNMMMPPPAMSMLGGGAPGQCGPQMGHHPGALGEKGPLAGPGPQHGEGPMLFGRGLDKKGEVTPAEPVTPPATIKK